MPRGGHRKNAGRNPTQQHKLKICFCVEPSVLQELNSQAEKNGMARSRYIEKIIEKFLEFNNKE